MADACADCEVVAELARTLNETTEKVSSKKDEVRSREDTFVKAELGRKK
jgi:hypothetical protein